MSGAAPASQRIADVVIVAAGRSSRMGGLDKLDAMLAGRPILVLTIEAVASSSVVRRIVVVVAEERVERLRGAPWLPSAIAAVVPGGARRQASVAAGIAALDELDSAAGVEPNDDGIVLVHDGARPLASPELFARVVAAVAAYGAAIPVVPVAETLKRVDGELVAGTVDRASLAAAQTPQGFRRGLLRSAYARFPPDEDPEWTDEAALFEACRIPVHVVPGDPNNLKVTLPDDLVRAEALLTTRAPSRMGIGRDTHPFGPGGPLALGGIAISDAPRLHGHSDGDVVLHAVADALLGAAGLGDLGRIFPAGPATPAGIASSELLADVVARVGAAGYRPVSLDVTVVGARPRLASHLDEMRHAIARLLGVPSGAVNVKASTGNLAGMEGAGRGISAEAIAQVEAVRPRSSSTSSGGAPTGSPA
ncbi:MAG TPA: 2-C-methyl-D-erythritol 4-phosphate cytidylyltransferase [Candidatus Dormibacteraeota bacterium]|nr:2-C-methyl-D-erythritol 4-phosphate cytidylyltransferase [Candidatus Dormibacteraeota bacterium]